VSEAESIWNEAKKHAGEARRRRKLAKLFARRAKKDAKCAKANWLEAREALTLEEAKLTIRVRQAARRKSLSAKPEKARWKKGSKGSRRANISQKPSQQSGVPRVPESTTTISSDGTPQISETFQVPSPVEI
jgi:hypothetical protein